MHTTTKLDFGLVSDALKILTSGLEAKTILHTYFGDVSTKIESLLDLPVFRFRIRYNHNTRKFDRKNIVFSDKILTVGIINSFNTAIEKTTRMHQADR